MPSKNDRDRLFDITYAVLGAIGLLDEYDTVTAEEVVHRIQMMAGCDIGEWQPIATAPEDGTPVMVCGVHGYIPQVGSFRTFHPNAQGKRCWRSADGHKLTPTWWLPLPKPPVKKT